MLNEQLNVARSRKETKFSKGCACVTAANHVIIA